jgi:hypothetical protein
MMRAVAGIALIAASVIGCRCGHGQQPESRPPSNESTEVIAYGLDWVPADTTVVARFGPGYGFVAEHLNAHIESPACAWALIDSVTASYMVHRFIADPPVRVVVGELPREETEACIVATLDVRTERAADDRVTRFSTGEHTTWLGWGDGMVVWHDDLQRVLDVIDGNDRLSPDAAIARLLHRLPRDGQGFVTTVDFSSKWFGVRSIGLVDAWREEEGRDERPGRLLFASTSDAAAMMAAYRARLQRGFSDTFGGKLTKFNLELLRPELIGDEVAIAITAAWRYPGNFIRLADFWLVPTGPE